MEKTLTKKAFPQWLKKLASWKVYVPHKDEEGRWNYVEADGEPVSLDVLQTTVPSKKVLFPQSEVFLEFSESQEGDKESLEVREVLPPSDPQVIFGVRPCEARAAWLLDGVFGGDPKDVYYWKRREQTTIVGLACTPPPSENCFCTSVEGSPHAEEGSDILLTDLGDKYFVRALSGKGEALIKAAAALFENPKPEDRNKLKTVHAESEKGIKRELKGARTVSKKLKSLFDSPFWDEEAMSCLRCGICTYLCPSCHCFDINDEIDNFTPLQGKRIRTWDTCQFPDFTMHSSGHNPRPDKASRLRQRLLHKFQYFVQTYDKIMCVGCGRCITLCPVGIDIIKVLDKVRDHGA
jgi:sulfhydrogenase subunit beta (sulfur reductase)